MADSAAPTVVPVGLTPDSRTPSALVSAAPAEAAAEGVEVVRYGAPLAVEVGLVNAELGTFLHRCFEVLGARADLAARLPQVTGVAVNAEGAEQIAAAVARFEAWVVEQFKPTSVQREWPLDCPYPLFY